MVGEYRLRSLCCLSKWRPTLFQHYFLYTMVFISPIHVCLQFLLLVLHIIKSVNSIERVDSCKKKRSVYIESIFLQRKSVTKKQMNKCMTEIYSLGGYEPGTLGCKANTITTELKRILPNIGLLFPFIYYRYELPM